MPKHLENSVSQEIAQLTQLPDYLTPQAVEAIQNLLTPAHAHLLLRELRKAIGVSEKHLTWYTRQEASIPQLHQYTEADHRSDALLDAETFVAAFIYQFILQNLQDARGRRTYEISLAPAQNKMDQLLEEKELIDQAIERTELAASSYLNVSAKVPETELVAA